MGLRQFADSGPVPWGRAAWEDPVYFAGEHCSVEFQGFMEGAAREGVRAAREIVQEAP